jgi:hypothetical protein
MRLAAIRVIVMSAALVAMASVHGADPERGQIPRAPAFNTGSLVHPCEQDSRELAAATAKLEALDRQIRMLQPGDDHVPANEALIGMLRDPCLSLSVIDANDLRAEAAVALVDFWNAGGKIWLESELEVARTRKLVPPPPMRKVMAPETGPGHGATALLCPLKDTACGRETQGWWLRAESFFKLNRRQVPRIDGDSAASVCLDEALAAAAGDGFRAWQRCAPSVISRRAAMPLGRMRVPAEGWLVVRGRRGHYSFCDEVRMYGLATGAAWTSQDCGLLRISKDIPAGRERNVLRGTLPLENLRELAWMLLQLDEVRADYPATPEGVRVPAQVELTGPVAAVPAPGRREEIEVVISSDQTTLAWAIIGPAGGEVASGTLRWPTDYAGGGIDHALELLRVAEGGFTEGCPREQPPEGLSLGRARSAVSPVDASGGELARTQSELVQQLFAATRVPCSIP